ncbi:hypothetical protein LOTGIDRAFT_169913 [Lottia gigantea]|uniref:CUB domain-containing protein n=1 Tax=Lottia gigantea TaxID=225164 RepID=V3ZER8_LOTGI|nr:hypothetical protein LOTGIDRAFT_169913 [Lottia gigantea]ESO82592.1 hypothetical protein LOTGIDRAFT_169913 [Lottia gigantea]
MWCNILLLFTFGNIIIQTNAVNMCTNASTVSLSVTLNLIKGTVDNGCNCSVNFQHTDKIKGSFKSRITFEVIKFSGCKYSLVIPYNKTESKASCFNNSTIFHDINKTDEIKLYLEPMSTYRNDTEFEVNITSNVTAVGGPLIRLSCFPPNSTMSTSESPSTTANKTSTPFSMETTNNTTISVIPTNLTTSSLNSKPDRTTDRSSSVSTNAQSTNASITPVSPVESTPNTKDSRKSNDEMKREDEHEALDIGVIGGVVGGVLILVILIIVIVVCIVRRKRKQNDDKKDYNRPTARGVDSDYAYINNGNNSSQDGVNIENEQNLRAEQTASSQMTDHGPIQMEIIDNELYVSSDDFADLKSRDDNITNQNPEISNSLGEMVITENDLYVSSDDLDHSPIQMEIIDNELYVSSDDFEDLNSRDDNITNQNPEILNGHVEMEVTENMRSVDSLNSPSNNDNAPIYAVINKKPKRPKSDSKGTSNDIPNNDQDTLL